MKQRCETMALLVMAMLLGVLAACGGSDTVSTADETLSGEPPPTEASQLSTTSAPVTTTTLSPLEMRAGVWEGTTDFGTFTFTVSPDGTAVTDFDLVYEEGGMTFSVSPGEAVTVPIDADNALDLQLGDTVFEVQFSGDGASATGYLEIEVPLAGNFSEEWKVTR